MPCSGIGPVPINPFSDWKNTLSSGGNVVRDQRRNADAEIDEIAGTKFLRDAPGDDGLCIHGSPVRDEIIDERRRGHDVVGRDDADRHDVLRRDDDGIGRHRHDRIEIARGQRVGEIAEIVGQKGVDQREFGAQRGLEQKRPCRRPRSSACLRSTEVPTPVGVSTPPRPQPPARMRSTKVPCGIRSTAIWLRQHLLLRLRIEADVACGQARDQRRVEQLADAFAGHRGVVADQRKTGSSAACTTSSSRRSGVPTPMNPPTMMLAPSGIIATASSTETALMIETPVSRRS